MIFPLGGRGIKQTNVAERIYRKIIGSVKHEPCPYPLKGN